MILGILFLVGIFVMIPKNITVSSGFEICRPKTFILGAITLVCVVAAYLLEGLSNKQGMYTPVVFLVYGIPLIVPIVSIFFLKQPKVQPTVETTQTKSVADKIVNIVTWLIISVVGLGVVWFSYRILTQ